MPPSGKNVKRAAISHYAALTLFTNRWQLRAPGQPLL